MVLLILITTLSLSALAIWATARVTRLVMARLGLDLMSALLWLGLAER